MPIYTVTFLGPDGWVHGQSVLECACDDDAIDAVGDIYLAGRLPLSVIDAEELDRILGCVLEYADSSFNTILRIGFETSIRREWQWRLSRGESTANLAAFESLREAEPPQPAAG